MENKKPLKRLLGVYYFSEQILPFYDDYFRVHSLMTILSVATRKNWYKNKKGYERRFDKHRRLFPSGDRFRNWMHKYLMKNKNYFFYYLKVWLYSEESFKQFTLFLKGVENPKRLRIGSISWSIKNASEVEMLRHLYRNLKNVGVNIKCVKPYILEELNLARHEMKHIEWIYDCYLKDYILSIKEISTLYITEISESSLRLLTEAKARVKELVFKNTKFLVPINDEFKISKTLRKSVEEIDLLLDWEYDTGEIRKSPDKKEEVFVLCHNWSTTILGTWRNYMWMTCHWLC